jgi:ankyrin repeat protein
MACSFGIIAWVQMLLERRRAITDLHEPLDQDQNLDWNSDLESSPLYLAAEHGHRRIVEVLIENGANINIQTRIPEPCQTGLFYVTPLAGATAMGHESTVETLLSRGADPELGVTALLAAVIGKQESILRLLLKDWEVNVRGIKAEYALSSAIKCGRDTIVRLLLDGGVDVNFEELDELHPLHLAIQRNNEAALQLLLDYNADIDFRVPCSIPALGLYDSLFTPLHRAATANAESIIKILADCGADLEATDSVMGQTALHWAACIPEPATLRALIESGADISARSVPLGPTPLHLAAISGSIKTAHMLLDHGAEVSAEADFHPTDESLPADRSGYNARDLAVLRGHEHMVQYLDRVLEHNEISEGHRAVPLIAYPNMNSSTRTINIRNKVMSSLVKLRLRWEGTIEWID